MIETLADIGEFGLIHRIHAIIEEAGVRSPGVTLGIGDDCASFRPHAGYEMLVTCDCIVEGRHFILDQITPVNLGRRSMALNISDIGAMGGQPLYAVVSLGLKSGTAVVDVEAMYRGFIAELNPFGASVIGGNLTKSADAMFIDITLIGEVKQSEIIRRSTAKTGDVILVTGYPGQSAAGLQLLLRTKDIEDVQSHPLVQVYSTPSHRAWEGQAIAKSGYATAMIDTSDGLLGDLGHICEESGVGAALSQEKIPVSDDLRQTALQLGMEPYELVLQDSDDYELIITCSPEHVDDIRSTIAQVSNVPVTEVGKMTDGAGVITLIRPDGTQRELNPTGWDHFTR